MRSLTSAMSTFLATNPRNVESVVIIGVDWSGDGQIKYYADKDILGIDARIINVGNLESVISFKTGSSFQFTFLIEDHSGTVKAALDLNDPYGKKVYVYQYFDDASLSFDDKFLLFVGEIMFDVAWDEKDRNVSFTITSEVSDEEVGFSPEEGQFDWITPDAIGKPWPLCFGSPLHVPAVKITQAAQATLNDNLFLVDPILSYKREILYQAILQNWGVYNYYKQLSLSHQGSQPYTASGMIAAMLTNIYSDFQALEQYRIVLADIAYYKAQLKLRQRGLVGGNIATIRSNLSQARTQKRLLEDTVIGLSALEFELLEAAIPILEASIETRKNSQDKQYEAVNAISLLYQEYKAIDAEIARQTRLYKNVVRVKDSEQFLQGEENVTDIFINNLRFRGYFEDGAFHIQAILPKYSDILLATRETLGEEYLPDEQYAAFWVPDAKIQLQGMYIYVYSSRTGHKHIAKVVEQKDRLCFIELNNHSQMTQSDAINERVNRASPFVPIGTRDVGIQIFQDFYNIGNFSLLNMSNFIETITSPEYMTSLGQLPYDIQAVLSGNFPGTS